MARYNSSTNNIFQNQPVTAPASGTAYTALQTDRFIDVTASAAFALTLPAPASSGATANVGHEYTIKDVAGNAATFNITISPASGNIDGAASYVLSSNYSSITVYSDGTNYWISSEDVPSLMPWTAVAASQSVAGNMGYYVTSAATLTLPTVATTTAGMVIGVTNVAGGWVIAQLATQSIEFGNDATTTGTGGSLTSSAVGDSVFLLAVSTAKWQVLNAVGNLLVT